MNWPHSRFRNEISPRSTLRIYFNSVFVSRKRIMLSSDLWDGKCERNTKFDVFGIQGKPASNKMCIYVTTEKQCGVISLNVTRTKSGCFYEKINTYTLKMKYVQKVLYFNKWSQFLKHSVFNHY